MKARPVKKLDPSRRLGENAARIVQVRLDEMMDFAPRALDGKKKAQHDMRIAAKRLRYVLEVTGFCFGRPADTARRRARDLQDILGEIHDCDVMLPRVRDHLKELQHSDAKAVGSGRGRRPTSIPGSRLRRRIEPPIAASTCSPSTSRLAASCSPTGSSPSGSARRRPALGSGWSARSTATCDARARRADIAKAAERARQDAEAAARAAAQAEAQAEQARLDRERANREAEAQADRHEQIQRRTSPAQRRPS